MGPQHKMQRRSAEEKREIYRQALEPGASVRATALRHGVNVSLFHHWLNDPRVRPNDRVCGNFLAVE
ncbi:transposase, partial [Roseibium sp. RKSG952]|uniref:transposase n=1 Tax=Roseibium sp. RKSG952 TaxID=2529384 RepID=UPI0012BB65EF